MRGLSQLVRIFNVNTHINAPLRKLLLSSSTPSLQNRILLPVPVTTGSRGFNKGVNISHYNADGDGDNDNHDHEHVGNGNVYLMSASAATGLALIFWAKTHFDDVNAAKPIHNQDQDDAFRNADRYAGGDYGGQVKKPKKTNRQRYNFISEVVEKVKDTVVRIEVKDHSHVDFFTGAPRTASNGSGFIVSDDGLILTNAHVVASRARTSFSVSLADGRTFSAVIEDIDMQSDLATIRITAKNLPTLPLGSSADTKLGEWVVAVGAPLSLHNTSTAGIVSSTSRVGSELGIHNDINYIQTDAAITFGNSGGPLINLDGEAIGLNAMKVTEGISFAIPIDHAKEFLRKAAIRKAKGLDKLARRYMGLNVLTISPQIRLELESRGYRKVSHGVLVWQVVVGSPAFMAGLKPGDIIVRANGSDLFNSADLYDAAKTSDRLQVQVQRGDQLYACTITPELVNE